MRVGMLWCDDDRSRSLEERLLLAVDYYHAKYGCRPNLCFVHPTTLAEAPQGSKSPVTLRKSTAILPDHFWLGVEENTEGSFAAAA